MKEKLLSALEQHFESLTSLKSELEEIKSTHISRVANQQNIKSVCRTWFDGIKQRLKQINIDSRLIEEYSKDFGQLLIYSRKSSFKQSVINLLDGIMMDYQKDFIHIVEIGDFDSAFGLNIQPYIESLEEDEKKYLEEAAKCAANACLRACIILGWCATINNIHKKILAEGLDNFNQTTKEMKSRDYGRFKRFNKEYKIASLSELREVFDTDILWILEYMQLIDKNQHERIRHCFTLRNNAAHPGEAPITSENLYSFYSDITEIVLKNNKFKIT